MSKYNIYHLAQFGDQFPIQRKVNLNDLMGDLEDFKDKWAPYNPRKHWIKREGLCILNERGECGPGPALDSIREYNAEHGTSFTERDFNVPTDFYYHSKAIRDLTKGMMDWCIRSHFLKLPPGGFFPPHRDHGLGEQTTFRIIVPIENCNPPDSRFIIEDTSLYWEHGRMYFVNTAKQHSLFNATASYDSIWLVINAIVCDESVEFISKNLIHR